MSDFDIVASITANEEDFIVAPSTDIFNTEENKNDCATYLKREIEEVESNLGRTTRMDRVESIRKQRLAIPDQETKDFPWENAANLRPPLALEKTNTVATKLLNMFGSRKPLFTYSTDSQEFKKNAAAISRHVQKLVENPNIIDLYRKNWRIFYDTTSLGTQFLKVPFVLDRMKFKRKTETGEEEVNKVIKASPDVHRIEFEDFLTRAEWADIDRAPWVAVRYYLHMHELQQKAQLGYYQDVETVFSEYVSLDEEKINELENMGLEESTRADLPNRQFKIYEVNIFWDTDGDGVPEDIIVHFEKETSTILRAEYNELGVRDYVRIPYIDIPNILYGLGVGEIVMPLQLEADALHNMRIDGQQLAMLPFVVVNNSSSFGRAMGLKPGKIIKAQNPKEDIIIHKFPDISQSAYMAEQLTLQYADKASGASNVLMGQDVGGSNRIGASGTQYLGAQAQSFLDTIGRQIASSYAKIGLLILYQLVKNSEIVDYSMLDETDAALCKEIYDMNVEDIPDKFKFNVEVTSIEQTPEMKRQVASQLLQMYLLYGDKMAQISGQVANPVIQQQAPKVFEMLNSYMVGLTKIMESILGNFDEANTGDYLPFIGDIQEALREADRAREQQLQQQRAVNYATERAVGEPTIGLGNEPSTGGRGIVSEQEQPISQNLPGSVGSSTPQTGQPQIV